MNFLLPHLADPTIALTFDFDYISVSWSLCFRNGTDYTEIFEKNALKNVLN